MKEVIIITDPSKVRVLSDDTRFKILQLLRQRPMSVNELSEAIGKDRSTIYRHIKNLEAAGLVEELESVGGERIYARTARMFLIKVGPDESIEQFRRAYIHVEAEKLVRILEKSGYTVEDRAAMIKLAEEVLDFIEVSSQPILKRVSEAEVELTEIELFHLLNMLVFLQSCSLCEKSRLAKKLLHFE